MGLADEQKTRRPENASGPYFIDDTCISCGACWRLAPELISSHPVHTFAFFSRQPGNTAETENAEAAVKLCPVNAIHQE